MIYMVESRQERLNRPEGVSFGVPAAGYTPQLFLHLLDLADDEVVNAVPLTTSGRPRVGPATGEWWFGDRPKAYWPGIQGPQLKSSRRPLHEVLAARQK